jgi:SAM-dependent methyltransferase
MALAENKLLVPYGERVWENTSSFPTTLPTMLLDQLKTSAEDAGLPLEAADLLLKSGQQFAAILTGKVDPAELYITESMLSIFEMGFSDFNDILRRILQSIIAALPSTKQLRIIEVGAGYGSMTRSLLPVLPPDRTTYFYTDISTYFLNLAQERWKSTYPFIQYDLLNIEKSVQLQGFEPHTFDIVATAGVLHATRNIKETLQNIRVLLGSQGVLFLMEPTRWHDVFNLGIMGLQQGFDRFEDEDLRLMHPLLTAEQWRQELLSCGFEQVLVLSEPGSAAEYLGVHLIVAQAPVSAAPLKRDDLRDFLRRKLPEYMVPSTVVLDALPLTSTGKVDRRALSQFVYTEQADGAESQQVEGFVAPRTPLERMIADAWVEVLKVEQVSIHDDFAELGGDSLHGALLISRLRKQLEIKELPLSSFFDGTTVAELAEIIEGMYPDELKAKLQ